MENGKVSIIIPVYNSQQHLQETLDSIVAQSYSNWECICIDDHSEDKSYSILQDNANKDNRFKVWKRPDDLPKGGNACRNFGFSRATGEYIQWFDSDDLMDREMIEKKISNLGTRNYVICRTAYFVDDIDELVPYDQNLDSKNLLLDYLTFKTKFFTPGPLFRASFIKKFQIIDMELKRHQEKEFFIRVILVDDSFSVVDEALIYRRMHDNQLSLKVNNSKKKLLLEFIASKKIFDFYYKQGVSVKNVNNYFKSIFFKY